MSKSLQRITSELQLRIGFPMSTTSTSRRNAHYKPALAWFAAIGSGWVLVLVLLGAFTTTIGAGMAFPDWPLSNGSLNPEGWLTDVAMFAEHSHRLSGATMGLITLGLAIWLSLTEARGWLRKLGWWAVAIVIVQGVIGGQRVRLDAWHVAGMEMSVGQLLRIPHGILAQVFVLMLFAIAAALSRAWIEAPSARFSLSRSTRQLGVLCTVLVLVQLVIAAAMRHSHAGLAIPTFPLTPEGTLVPTFWDYRIGIHYAHRVMAAVLAVALVWYAVAVWVEQGASRFLKNLAGLIVATLMIQITLGIMVIWTLRGAYYTTAHVMVGALTLGLTFLLTWFAHRNSLQAWTDTPGSFTTSDVQQGSRSTSAAASPART